MRLKVVTIYFKYHNEVSRIFEKPYYTILAYYYTITRKLNYQKVVKIILNEKETKNPELKLERLLNEEKEF